LVQAPYAPTAGEGTSASSPAEAPQPGRERLPTFVAIDEQSFRVLLRDEQVWNAAIEVLMRNYNLTTIDRASGLVTTEWDSFYLNQSVYRNKVSLRVTRLSYGSCQLSIVNNVEVLRDGSAAAAGTIGPIWLPSRDEAQEARRIVRNIALLLKQSPPLVPAKLAKSQRTR